MKTSNLYTAISYNNTSSYPHNAPFDPDRLYPEYEFKDFKNNETNSVYDQVRNVLIDAELDIENLGKHSWSPLKDIVKPNDTVVIKPNLVLNTPLAENQNIVTTHASVIRPIIDYCWKAMNKQGLIIVGDAPQAETDFELVTKRNGLCDTVLELQKRGVNIVLKDFRSIKVIIKNGIWIDEQETQGNPEHIIVKLNEQSLFYTTDSKKIRYHGGGYDSSVTMKHHHNGIHEYKVSKDILIADAVISIPKLKTHKKAGITCCLKNLVGINVDKNYLPHFIIGPANKGGDEMPEVKGFRLLSVSLTRFFRDIMLDKHWRITGKIVSYILHLIYKNKTTEANLARVASESISKTNVFQGAWQGNNTIWKMILDLNKIFLYADNNGKMLKHTPRKIFYIVDGIIAGDRNGPMEPDAVNLGIIAGGINAFLLDTAILDFLNINWQNIPLYKNAEQNSSWLVPYKHKGIKVNGNDCYTKINTKFNPPDNWKF